MAPTLQPGDQLLVERLTFRWRSPRLGEVVLVRDPRQPSRELIKRVWAIGDAGVELRGDGTASTDSRAFGSLPFDTVAWRVAFRYWPLSRFGPVGAASVPAEPLGGEPACSTFGDLVVASNRRR